MPVVATKETLDAAYLLHILACTAAAFGHEVTVFQRLGGWTSSTRSDRRPQAEFGGRSQRVGSEYRRCAPRHGSCDAKMMEKRPEDDHTGHYRGTRRDIPRYGCRVPWLSGDYRPDGARRRRLLRRLHDRRRNCDREPGHSKCGRPAADPSGVSPSRTQPLYA